MPTKSRAELFDILRALLREALHLQAQGAGQPQLSKAQGYVDGFVRGLVESGVADHRALLAVVREVRAELGGPATGELADRATLAA